MTTAHRPTFDPARGKESLRGPAYHQRLLPAHKTLKLRQDGQGTETETSRRDLRSELLKAEAAHFAKKGKSAPGAPSAGAIEDGKERLAIEDSKGQGEKRAHSEDESDEDEDPEVKRRRKILEEFQEVDADSSGSSDEEDESEEESEEEDEEAVLMRELEKIKKERAEAKAKEEAERQAKEAEKREVEIARGNPLLNTKQEFGVKRRWDDDVVFKNQARGTEEKEKRKEFVNDLLRSDFHKRFMKRYVR
ncbi:MAG: complexed with cef1p [Bogoriella megaspora]|nr:MAG: complexed with cef1p [Bogoriella megaspora]